MLTKSQQKFNKLYYPGVISLSLLPIICILYITFNKTLHRNYGTDFITISRADLSDTSRKYWVKSVIKLEKNCTNIVLSGISINDDTEKKRLIGLINHLVVNKDTANVITVELEENSKYNELVYVVDLCHQNNNIAYSFFNDRFYIKYFPLENTFTDTYHTEMPL